MEFITGPNALYLEKGNLLSGPFVPSLASFMAMVVGVLSSEEFRWMRGAEEEVVQNSETRSELVYMIRTEWMYAVLCASELKKKVMTVNVTF